MFNNNNNMFVCPVKFVMHNMNHLLTHKLLYVLVQSSLGILCPEFPTNEAAGKS